jgi:hypothetical protein
MKLTKKQQIISLIAFLPLIPVSLSLQIIYGLCFFLSEVLNVIGETLRPLNFAIGELFLKFGKRIK